MIRGLEDVDVLHVEFAGPHSAGYDFALVGEKGTQRLAVVALDNGTDAIQHFIFSQEAGQWNDFQGDILYWYTRSGLLVERMRNEQEASSTSDEQWRRLENYIIGEYA